MLKLKNIGGDIAAFAPPGSPSSMPVDAGATVDVPGVVAKQTKKQVEEGAEPFPDDALMVELPDGDLRAYPTSQWELVKDTDSKKES